MALPPSNQDPRVPLLGHSEKAELEKLILAKFLALFDAKGGSALLDQRLRVVVDARGVDLDYGETADPLAAVDVKTLFTALCYMTGGTASVPREAIDSLATEATSAAAGQINRIGAG